MSTVASQPALQCVSTLTLPLRLAISRNTAEPCRPIERLKAMSSSAIFSASFQAASARADGGIVCSRRVMRSIAQRKLIAVGRVLPSNSAASFKLESAASAAIASAMP
jgi:hypothetical protein